MEFITNSGIIIITIAAMEAFSWLIHKYLFHGPLWFIHRSHHRPHSSWLEFNDVFSVLFAGISMYLMWEGRLTLNTGFWIGTGISVYGIIYFIFHDWFIHNRLKSFRTTNRYLLGIRRAHKIHHKSLRKNPSEEFGLLLASGKYFKKQQTERSH
ncbi:MAG: sterol desaturase family protein [Daejeonella sp.]